MVNDISGNKYGNWTVLRYDTGQKWICQCDCGNICSVRKSYLIRGRSTKCKECALKKLMYSRVRHGASQTRLYGIWNGMKQRCTNSHTKWYENYGAKGITVCSEWQTFDNFYKWSIENGYADDLTIDRIDTTGNYEPSNCRWADIVTQANNTSRNHYITYNNETHTISEWSKISGVNPDIIRQRLKKGWDPQKAIYEISYKGKNQFYKEVKA